MSQSVVLKSISVYFNMLLMAYQSTFIIRGTDVCKRAKIKGPAIKPKGLLHPHYLCIFSHLSGLLVYFGFNY